MNDEALRYPTGRFSPQATYSQAAIEDAILHIALFPTALEAIMRDLPDERLDTPYRHGGWTARQVIHHIADSHMNAYIRFKWTLTEPTPVIKAYNEKLWAETAETKEDPALSLAVVRALHAKWATLLKALTPPDLQRMYIHPETNKHLRLDEMIVQYAWHGNHHLGHLKIIVNGIE